MAQPYAHLHDDNINIIIVQETRAGMRPAPASSMQEASSATMTTREGSKACMQLKHASMRHTGSTGLRLQLPHGPYTPSINFSISFREHGTKEGAQWRSASTALF